MRDNSGQKIFISIMVIMFGCFFYKDFFLEPKRYWTKELSDLNSKIDKIVIFLDLSAEDEVVE